MACREAIQGWQAACVKSEALDDPRDDTPDPLSPAGTTDRGSVATGFGNGVASEIKEWQAIMDHLHSLPVAAKGELPVIPVDSRAAEVRAIKTACSSLLRGWTHSSYLRITL